MKISRPHQALFVFVCFLLACAGLSAQQKPKADPKYKSREQDLIIDIPLTLTEITAINIFGNICWRLWGPDSEAAYFTLDSISHNLNPGAWSWEAGLGGDTFLVNQLFHPFAGGFYFASARSNNFNFYLSMLSPFLGSLQWETFAETDMPAKNDLITTTSGGIVLGEILHRLYIELDKGGGAGKIGATILSPTDRITAALRGYGPEEGPNRIRSASLAFGVSWLYARFFEASDETIYWKRPSVFADFDLVYDDPYTAHSKTPFDQFDLFISLTLAIPQIYNLAFISNGYLASWVLVDDEVSQASNGITMNFDCYVTDRGFTELNNGRENLNFTASSLDYSIKWRRIINPSLELSLKTHIGLSPWTVATYNGGENKDDYNLFSFGGNVKLFFELREMKENSLMANGQSLTLSLCVFGTFFRLLNTPGFDNNALFFSARIAYSLPLGNRFSFYAADNLLCLYCRPAGDAAAQFPDITRWYNNAQFGIKITFR